MKMTIIFAALLLAGCGKFNDLVSTGVDGYSLRCIEGTKYILLTSERGLAITPAMNAEGKPKSCEGGNQ